MQCSLLLSNCRYDTDALRLAGSVLPVEAASETGTGPAAAADAERIATSADYQLPSRLLPSMELQCGIMAAVSPGVTAATLLREFRTLSACCLDITTAMIVPATEHCTIASCVYLHGHGWRPKQTTIR